MSLWDALFGSSAPTGQQVDPTLMSALLGPAAPQPAAPAMPGASAPMPSSLMAGPATPQAPSSPLPSMAAMNAPMPNFSPQPQGFGAIKPVADGAPVPATMTAGAPSGLSSDGPAISVPGYDGKFTRSQANDGDGVPSSSEWDAASKGAVQGPSMPDSAVASGLKIGASLSPTADSSKSHGWLDNITKVVGGLYGQGNPGDGLINLGIGMSSGPGGMQRALQMTQSQDQQRQANQIQQINMQLAQQKLMRDQQNQQGGAAYVKAMYAKQGVTLSDDQAQALAGNSSALSTIASNTIKDQSTAPKWGVIGEDQYGNKQYGYPPAPGATPATPPGSVQPPTAASPSGNSDLMGLHGSDFLGKLASTDPAIAGQVQAIVEGRAPYPAGMLIKTPYGQKLAAYVTQTDPTFEAGNAAARMKVRNEFEAGGPSSPAGMITAGNTAIQHLGHLSDAAASLGNYDSGIPGNNLVNAAGNAIAQSAGKGTAVTQFNNILGKYVEEATKFYRGSGGTEADIQRDIGNLSSSMSPTQLHAAIQTQVGLLQSKINALQDRWKQGMGPLVPDFPIIQSESQSVLGKIAGRAGVAPSDAALSPPSGAPAAPPPIPGARQAGDGNWYVPDPARPGKYLQVK